MHLLCCCYSRKASSNSSYTIDNANAVEVKNILIADKISVTTDSDSIERISIDHTLDNTIKLWTDTIELYRQLEAKYVSSISASASIKIIVDLRVNPDKYINTSDESVKQLAKVRNDIYLYMSKLGIKVGNKSDATYDSSSLTELPFDFILNNQSTIAGVDANTAGASTSNDVDLYNGRNGYIEKDVRDNGNSVSDKWSIRLKELDTQRNLPSIPTTTTAAAVTTSTTASPPASPSSSRYHPRWPEFLCDVTYNVTKVNAFGQQRQRVLKFTEYHIIDITNGGKTIKHIYLYTEIRRVLLKDYKKTIIILKDNRSVTYVSAMASHIVQQVTTRVKLRLRIERAMYPGTVGTATGIDSVKHQQQHSSMEFEGVVYSFETAAALVASITKDNLEYSAATVQSFAESLRMNAIHKLGNSTNLALKVTTAAAAAADQATPRSMSQLHVFKEGSIESDVEKKVRSILSDTNTDECATTVAFINNFHDNRYTLIDVRNYIDGMHEHILLHRGSMLAEILGSASNYSHIRVSEYDKPSVSSNSTSNNSGSSTGNSRISYIDEYGLEVLSFIIFNCVEEFIFLPLRTRILSLLKVNSVQYQQIKVIENISKLKSMSQIQMGIPTDFISPLGWQNAIFELSGLEQDYTPSKQMYALTRASKSIYTEFKHMILPALESKNGKGSSSNILTGDDFLPIFIYVFVQSTIQEPLLCKELMWLLCHPDQLHGEFGYFLTVFESAIEFASAYYDDAIVSIATSTDAGCTTTDERDDVQLTRISSAFQDVSTSNKRGSITKTISSALKRLSQPMMSEINIRESFA